MRLKGRLRSRRRKKAAVTIVKTISIKIKTCRHQTNKMKMKMMIPMKKPNLREQKKEDKRNIEHPHTFRCHGDCVKAAGHYHNPAT